MLRLSPADIYLDTVDAFYVMCGDFNGISMSNFYVAM